MNRSLRFLSLFLTSALVLAACGTDSGRHGPGGDNGDGGTSKNQNLDPNVDADGDGYSPAQGDCDDTTPLVGPNSVEVNGNGIDDDCNGQIDDAAPCDTGVAGQKTADALAKAIGFCWPKFLTGSKFNGPSDPGGRNTLTKFGVLPALEGAAMAYISSGDASGASSYLPQEGTDFQNTYQSPYAGTIKAPPANGCGMGAPTSVNDYTELELDLTVPYNANSFSFQSQFFSAEYPEWVCSEFNDRFLVILDDGQNPQQIEYDTHMNPVTVNNSFFSICQNSSSKPQTQHCTMPISAIMGTGYDKDDGGGEPIGGSTGWLTTTVPVVPGDHLKLRFIVFDEGDGILDSSALIDNFQWQTGMVAAPVTIQ